MLTPADLGLPPTFPSFRVYPGFSQLDSASQLASSPHRFSLLQAPPGSGKSLLALTLSRLLGARTLYLTVTKSLQSQLLSDFSSIGLHDIRGHSNYPCASAVYDDDTGELADLECMSRSGGGSDGSTCFHQRDVIRCLKSDLVTTNYAYWTHLRRVDDIDRLGKFDLLVCDEAHQLPELLCDLISVRLNRRYLKIQLGINLPSDLHTLSDIDQLTWALDARQSARNRYTDLRRSHHHTEKDLLRVKRVGLDLNRLIEGLESSPPWVSQKTSHGVTFSPVWPDKYAEDWLFRGIPRIILQSATLSQSTGKYLGIPAAKSDYREVESSFPVSHRPFIYIPTTKVWHGMTEGQSRILVRRVDSIIEGRLDRKGIIQTRSYKRADELVSHPTRPSRFAEFILTHKPYNARETIDRFMESDPPTILASPTIEEGVDFIGEMARYQIILKVPFVDGRDPLITARVKSDKEYKYYLAAQSILQMSGRPVRSETDFAETFILDDHWSWFQRKPYFPKYFRKAWRRVEKVPLALRIVEQANVGRAGRRDVG